MDNNLYTGILQICRTCLKEIIGTSFFYLDCKSSAITQLTIRQTLYRCIPELDLSMVPNAVMCSNCVDKLLSVVEFKKNCLQSEIQINKYIQQVQHTGDLNLVEVVQFHQPDVKNLDSKIKMEDLEIIEDFKNENIVCDTSTFTTTESFHQPDFENVDIKVKIEDLEIKENFKNEDLFCDGAFNKASECTESTKPKYVVKLERDDMQYVPFNTYDDYNINYNLSAAEKKSDTSTHNSSIAQNCLREVIVHDHNYSKNLNKTHAYYQCYKCGHKVESQLKLILHLKHHRRTYFYHEKIISRRLSRYKNLICYYRCSLCNYFTKYKCLFDFHIRIHFIKNYQHIFKLTNVHTKAFRKQHFSHGNSLKPNNREDIVENPYKCSVCEYQSNLKGDLKRHMQIHTGEKPFSCSVCEYQCNRKGHLKQHMLIHTGEKPFSCSVCEYRCIQKSHLKQHMRIHTGEKPFSCSVCEYQCSQTSHLKQHIIIHTGEKPFSCPVCEYQCNRNSNLKQHILIHTKPLSCSVCEYRCSQKRHLKKHMLLHT